MKKVGLLIAIGLLTTAVLCLGLLWLFNERILMSNSIWNGAKLLVAATVPPADFYAPVLQANIDLSQPSVLEGKFKLKYPGRYKVGIMFSGVDSRKIYEARQAELVSLIVRLTFKSESGHTFSQVIDRGFSPFIDKVGGGLSFLIMLSPEDIPVNKTIYYQIEIVSPDTGLQTTFGPATLFISKISDK